MYLRLECSPLGEPYKSFLSLKRFSTGFTGQVKLKSETLAA
jgi:hypothetical protein